jgi:hypothetical protein
MCTVFWRGTLKERNYLEDPRCIWGIILEWIFNRLRERGLIWLRIVTAGFCEEGQGL